MVITLTASYHALGARHDGRGFAYYLSALPLSPRGRCYYFIFS